MTDLCNIMKNYGSDKGLGWHNYTTLYTSLFEKNRYGKLNVFEMGIGTNNPNIPSSMGTEGKPGASLYGWSEYFPNSRVYAADIDKDIIFNDEEKRIETFYCDQTNVDDIKNMWNSIPDVKFDIFIDDGLHDFPANKILFENTVDKMKLYSYYIVEDILSCQKGMFQQQIKVWETQYKNMSFQLIDLYNERNNVDNILLIIYKFSESLASLDDNEKYTIVTGYFNINRVNWNEFQRSKESYMNNAQRMMSLNNNMILFVEPDMVEFVKAHRDMKKTVIVETKLEELKYYKYLNNIKTIMQSEEFKHGLIDPTCPEVSRPEYDIIMWSKVSLVTKAIEMNCFKSSHYMWMDFGIHVHMLPDQYLNKPLTIPLKKKIKFLCRSRPQITDLDIKKFYKSHTNRLAGTMFTASDTYMNILESLVEEEVLNALNNNVVDNDQSIFNTIYLKNKHLFELYNGDWSDLLKKYV